MQIRVVCFGMHDCFQNSKIMLQTKKPQHAQYSIAEISEIIEMQIIKSNCHFTDIYKLKENAIIFRSQFGRPNLPRT